MCRLCGLETTGNHLTSLDIVSLLFNLVKCVCNSKKKHKTVYNFSFGWSSGKAVHFIYLSYLLLFQFVVNGGLGCLSYKHPKKITVSILCHKQSKFSGSAALKNQNLKKSLFCCLRFLKNIFQTHINFLIPLTIGSVQ